MDLSKCIYIFNQRYGSLPVLKTYEEFVSVISGELLRPEKSISLAMIFREILPDLVEHLITFDKNEFVREKRKLPALSKGRDVIICDIFDVCERAYEELSDESRVLFAFAQICEIEVRVRGVVGMWFEKNLDVLVGMIGEYENVECLAVHFYGLYRMLSIFRRKRIGENWSNVFELKNCENEFVRFVAFRILDVVYALSLEERSVVEKQFEERYCLDEHDWICGIKKRVVEFENVPEDIPRKIFEKSVKEETSSDILMTESVKSRISEMEKGLMANKAILLEGPAGSGKTTLVQHLAKRNGQSLLRIHMGEQTDSKALLGSYVCTDIPGEFKWQPGVISVAVSSGKWLLIEDVDLVNMDTISMLQSLFRSNEVFIPSRGERISAHENFRLFVTARSLKNTIFESLIGRRMCFSVQVKGMSEEESTMIIKTKYPFEDGLMDVILKVKDFICGEERVFNKRVLTFNDVLKWTGRLFELGQGRIHETELILESLDCFGGFISNMDDRREFMFKIGEIMEMNEEAIKYGLDVYQPKYEINSNNVKFGRSVLDVVRSGMNEQLFAYTKLSLNILEKISTCVKMNESVLLVGSTGTGKTTSVQQLASLIGQELVVINLSQQSEASDLLGGYKPIPASHLALPLKEEFDNLFIATFSKSKNEEYLDNVRKAFIKQKWDRFITLIRHSSEMAIKKLSGDASELLSEWIKLNEKCKKFQIQSSQMKKNALLFGFVEGALLKAIRQGQWVLLDEVNLASSETLQVLSGLLQDNKGSITLTERGDVEPIPRNEDFRLFACMNPSNDIGKKDLPPALRSKFTEIFVDEIDCYKKDLEIIVGKYLNKFGHYEQWLLGSIVEFYYRVKKASNLYDTDNKKPHFSMRTLTRALSFAISINKNYPILKCVYEGICVSFTTQLNEESFKIMNEIINSTILLKRNISQCNIVKNDDESKCLIEGYLIDKGNYEIQEENNSFILTRSVKNNLKNLARAVQCKKYPILIQGPTSVGKSSIIKYLADLTGNKFVRINNHEHTDIQEYFGSYVNDSTGKLVYKQGILVEAVKNGYWIVLDELNLAPTEVLESLNRLLDDNREIFLPETQETIKAHPNFILFATQNPPGMYGGRKTLSKAFRNRFLELHFDNIPSDEMEEILSKKCIVAPSYCKKMVLVYQELIDKRPKSKIFSGKHGFITLRDLFKWAERNPNSYQELAEIGYMLLAERIRDVDEKGIVKKVLEQVIKVEINEDDLYDLRISDKESKQGKMSVENNEKKSKQSVSNGSPSVIDVKSISYPEIDTNSNLIFTSAMKRLLILVYNALLNKEPVLLIGATGIGKTSLCQWIAEYFKQNLLILNCHQHTESSDFLGSQRPCRDNTKSQLFEWIDGPLVSSMVNGDIFLMDEISLAEDSVLERLNSVLESARILTIPERENGQVLTASDEFRFIATMNPGGDFGKKELSPALRNRFTEIWVPPVDDYNDLLLIVENKCNVKEFAKRMIDFVFWMKENYSKFVYSLRDLISWCSFINSTVDKLDKEDAFVNGGSMIFLDCLNDSEFKQKALNKLSENYQLDFKNDFEYKDNQFGINPFYINLGPLEIFNSSLNDKFNLNAPTTKNNLIRILRAMQLDKSILMEGNPGVGKTSLISALSAITGHNLVRINLSDQTDIMDLFGSDLPCESGSGTFKWKDGPFLRALKDGHWILLDELNLASQSVLEGLNACLDHRGTVYIPELNKEFKVSKNCRIFAAQNPSCQGGGRKGLPKSFLNRFTQVYVDLLTSDDLLLIVKNLFRDVPAIVLERMLRFNSEMQERVVERKEFGRKGSPWEFNLRDTFRWINLVNQEKENVQVEDENELVGVYSGLAVRFARLVYSDRMRSLEDRNIIKEILKRIFEIEEINYNVDKVALYSDKIVLGSSSFKRFPNNLIQKSKPLSILSNQLNPLENLLKCIEMNTLAIIIGPSMSGKTSLVQLAGQLMNQRIEEFSVSSSLDTSELLGGFEQIDLNRHEQLIIHELQEIYVKCIRNGIICGELSFHDVCEIDKIDRLLEAIEHVDSFALNEELLGRIGLLQEMKEKSVQGKFEWVDGTLLQAMEKGYWVVLENANLCNASVLDRLNSLFDNDRYVAVHEAGVLNGELRIVRPHENFRLFMTMDPQYGEISRAMRNRGVEIVLLDQIHDMSLIDKTRLLKKSGVYSLKEAGSLASVGQGSMHQLDDLILINEICCSGDVDIEVSSESPVGFNLENSGLILKERFNEYSVCLFLNNTRNVPFEIVERFLLKFKAFDLSVLGVVEEFLKMEEFKDLMRMFGEWIRICFKREIQEHLKNSACETSCLQKAFSNRNRLERLEQPNTIVFVNHLNELLNETFNVELFAVVFLYRHLMSCERYDATLVYEMIKIIKSNSEDKFLFLEPFNLSNEFESTWKEFTQPRLKIELEFENEIEKIENYESDNLEERKCILGWLISIYSGKMNREQIEQVKKSINERIKGDVKRECIEEIVFCVMKRLEYLVFNENYEIVGDVDRLVTYGLRNGMSLRELEPFQSFLFTGSKQDEFHSVVCHLKSVYTNEFKKGVSILTDSFIIDYLMRMNDEKKTLALVKYEENKNRFDRDLEVLKNCPSVELKSSGRVGEWISSLKRIICGDFVDPAFKYKHCLSFYEYVFSVMREQYEMIKRDLELRVGIEKDNKGMREILEFVEYEMNENRLNLVCRRVEEEEFKDYCHDMITLRDTILIGIENTFNNSKSKSEMVVQNAIVFVNRCLEKHGKFKDLLNIYFYYLLIILKEIESEKVVVRDSSVIRRELNLIEDVSVNESVDLMMVCWKSLFSRVDISELIKAIKPFHLEWIENKKEIKKVDLFEIKSDEEIIQEDLKKWFSQEEEEEEQVKVDKFDYKEAINLVYDLITRKDQVDKKILLDLSHSIISNDLINNTLNTINSTSTLNFNDFQIVLQLFILKSKNIFKRKPFNFYKDQDEEIMLKSLKILKEINEKIEELLQQYQDNQVLINIKELIIKLMNKSIKTSLIDFVGILENILEKCYSWESIAASFVSLKVEISKLSNLIVEIRRIELNSWKNMILTIEYEFENETIQWGYHLIHLFEQLLNGNVKQNEIIELIDRFIVSSNVGEVEYRFQFIESFVKLIDQEIKVEREREVEGEMQVDTVETVESSQSKVDRSVLRAVKNHLNYYKMLIEALKNKKMEIKTPIEKELKEYVTLVSWKDVNLYSLRETTQKSHRMLVKCIRKYKNFLHEPVSLYFQSISISNVEEFKFDLKGFKLKEIVLNEVELKEFKQFDELLDLKVVKTASRLASEGLEFVRKKFQLKEFEELINLIIERMKFLQTNEKATRQMKQLALNELFVELKRIGLSDRISQSNELIQSGEYFYSVKDLMESISEFSFLDLDLKSIFRINKNCNDYYSRIINKIKLMRQESYEYSKDLNEQILRKCIGFIEHLLMFIVKERELLNELNLKTEISFLYEHFKNDFKIKVYKVEELIKEINRINSIISRINLIQDFQNLNMNLNIVHLLNELVKASDVLNIDFCFIKVDLLNSIKDLFKNKVELNFELFKQDEIDLVKSINRINEIVDEIKLNKKENEFESCKSLLLFCQQLYKKNKVEDRVQIEVDKHEQVNEGVNDGLNTDDELSEGYLKDCLDLLKIRNKPTMNSLTNLQYNIYLEYLKNSSLHHRLLNKFTFILIETFTNLFKQGYCNSNQDEETQGGEMEATGTGAGEGVGKKDVSDEIEEEGQLDGLQQEEKQDNEGDDRGEDDKGFEMENDFDGEIESVNNDDNENEQQDKENENEKDEMGSNLDGDEENELDPDLWDDNEDKANGESSIRKSKKEDNLKAQEQEGDERVDEREEREERVEDERDDDDDDDNENDGDNDVEQSDIEISDSELNQLNEKGDNKEEFDFGSEQEDFDIKNENEEIDDEQDEQGDEFQDPLNEPDVGVNNESDKDEGEEKEETIGDEVDDDKDDNIDNIDEGEMSVDEDELNKDGDEMDLDNQLDEKDENISKENKNEAQVGLEDENKNTDDIQGISESNKESNNETENLGKSNNENGNLFNHELNENKNEKNKISEMSNLNPFENISEILEKINSTLNLLNEKEIKSNDNKINLNENQNLMQVDENEDDLVLANSMEQKETRVNEINKLEQVDEEEQEINEERDKVDERDKDENNDKVQTSKTKEESQTEKERFNEVNEANNNNDEVLFNRDSIIDSFKPSQVTQELNSIDNEPANVVELFDSFNNNSLALNEWLKYEQSVSNLSLELTEQLRLILEPTLASKLKGDYKTGKRLNMRKIIPYIASDFKKDKIWQRRTLPNKRNYNVLLSLDDSLSMSESKSISLAFQSLALVSKSLNLLEIGNLAVIGFGDSINKLHSFDSPFNENSGAHLISNLHFNQTKTNTKHLLETALDMFSSLNSISNIDNWNLHIILSDGICDDHQTLRSIVRQSLEHKIMTLFVVLDKRSDKDSILNIKSVQYEKVGDSFKMKVKSYMDSFPFDYYVVLNNIEHLPNVLGMALKQWFEMAQEYTK